MNIYYGFEGNYKNINDIIFEKNESFFIPNDHYQRSLLFGDNGLGNLNKFIISINNINYTINEDVKINKFEYKKNNNLVVPVDILENIQKNIYIVGGNIKEEYPEQLLSVKYIDSDDKVLEIGSNIGRNSCIISSILNDSRNLVTLESNINIYNYCLINKFINCFNFIIENKALSYIPLQQCGWNTFPLINDNLHDGYFKVDTITYEDLVNKYNIDFNVLVLDCEGAIYHILKSNPNILKNINKIIIENDFESLEHFEYVQSLFFQNGFKIFYSCKLDLDVDFCCKDFFYQVYMK